MATQKSTLKYLICYLNVWKIISIVHISIVHI